jgi:preprotein translocase subunit YajC
MNIGPLLFLLAMIAVLWFLLIRPQRARQAAHRELIARLDAGDEVVTAGGILGRVSAVAEDHVKVEVAPGIELRFAKDAVTGVLRKDEETPAEAENRG